MGSCERGILRDCTESRPAGAEPRQAVRHRPLKGVENLCITPKSR